MTERPGFLGYRRPDGRVGVRNHVLVVPTVICSSVVCERIAERAAGRSAGAAAPGRLRPARARHAARRTRRSRRTAGIRTSARCSSSRSAASRSSRRRWPSGAARGQAGARSSRFRAKAARVRDDRHGDADRASSWPRDRWRRVARVVRRHVARCCRSSAADRTTRRASRRIRRSAASPIASSTLGGAAVLGEIAEIMGAEHLLAARASRPDVGRQLLRVIDRVEAEAMALGLDIRGTQPSPGNIRGGLTTIEEKSLGATHKGGERSPLVDVVPYAGARSRGQGLTVMDTPGLDVESVTGMVGGGAQVVVFTTGLGTPTGNPDRAGHQDHRQRAHGAADGRQHRSRRERRHRRHRDARRRRRIGCSTKCSRSRPASSTAAESAAAIASSRFTAAIPTI